MLILNFAPFTSFETERMLIHRFKPGHIRDIFKLRSHPVAMKYIGKPLMESLEEAGNLVEMYNKNIQENTSITFGISFKNKPLELIGSIGYHTIDRSHHRAEIGYMIFPNYWGKGIMSEVLAKFIDFGFSDLGLHSIEAKVNPENLLSAKILLKHGFEKEAYFRQNYYFEGEFLDTEVYSLVKEQG